jgi:phospholipase C
MDDRREFLKKASLLSGGAGLMSVLPSAIAKALAINPAAGSTYLDAEHVVFLMQENRSFDHAYGTLQGVRGFNDPRAIDLPNKNKVWLQSKENGDTYAPFRLDIKNTKSTWMHSLPHSWSNQVDARNNGKYDKWLDIKHSGHEEYKDMPLTLGYCTREDIPFYYQLADAFTVCDQNFCSSLTGTTPNRLYFWTGTIREELNANAQAKVWNEDADLDTMVSWKTFPERLEENGISWKVYQNELYVQVGFQGEEEPWLSNFGDNPLEYIKQYQVKLSAAYIAYLPKSILLLKEEIKKQETLLSSQEANSKEAVKTSSEITGLKNQLAGKEKDRLLYTKEKYDQLSQHEKNIHDKAFSTNKKDPDYHKLTTVTYKDGSAEREVEIPKGDILHEFRNDVQQGKLPAVSWIVAPERYSDHPSSAWYGSWYMSEVMNILTENPEVWKKTIFVLTYDENDGYFDHVPPFVAPHPDGSSGFTSKSIDPALDYVTNAAQQSMKDKRMRVSPIGLGYRVPLVIASPWSRGGWVNSEVFDHTSSLQFLEHFLSHKTGKKIQETNITNWRRTVCGNLSSVFRPYNGEKIVFPTPVKKDTFIQDIHKAQYKDVPSNFRKLSADEITDANQNPEQSPFLPKQEKGIRSSCALAYELYSQCTLSQDKNSVSIEMHVGNTAFGRNALGSPFQIFAPGKYGEDVVRTWDYAVTAGDTLRDDWQINHFDNDMYHLRVYGPNGFYREFTGNKNDPELTVNCGYEKNRLPGQKLSGNIEIQLSNNGKQSLTIEISDNAYGTPKRTILLSPAGTPKAKQLIILNLQKSFGWYDCSVHVKGNEIYQQSFAGRVETGKSSKTDPVMGRTI